MDDKPDDPRRALWTSRADIFLSDADLRQSAAASAGQSSVKAIFLANGGALLALLTLVGNSIQNFGERGLWWAFFWFGSGFFLSIIAHWTHYRSLGYFTTHARYCATQLSNPGFAPDFEERKSQSEKMAVRFRNGTFFALCISAFAFVVGALVGLEAIV